MATTRIQSGGVTALSITHDKLHTDMNLSTKTVVLPTMSSDITLSSTPYPRLYITDTVGVDRQFSVGVDNERFKIRNETGSFNAFVIDNVNKVALGHDLPTSVLDVKGEIELRDKTGNLAHGMSVFSDTDVYAIIAQESSGNGGLRITSLSDATTAASAFQINAVATTPSTDGNNAAIRLRTAKKNGTTEQALAATEDVLSIGNVGTELVVVKGSGNFGIGDASPAELLTVKDGNIKLKSNNDGNKGILMLYDAAGTQSGQVYPSAGDLRIWSPNDVLILPSGNVGIGTDTPNDKLEVLRTSTDQTVGLTLTNLQAGGYGSGIVWKSRRGDAPNTIKETAKIVVAGENSWGSDNDTASQMQFWTQKDNTLTKHMTLNKNGKLGIGIASPGNTLHVTSPGHNTYSSTVTKGSNHTGLSIVQEGGNSDMTGVFFGSGGSGSGSHWSAITGSRTAHSSHWGTQLNFYTHANDTANLLDATQKMIIDGAGNVGIGSNDPLAKLHVQGNAVIGNIQPYETTHPGESGATLHVHNIADDGGDADGEVNFGDETQVIISTGAIDGGSQGYQGSLWFGTSDHPAGGSTLNAGTQWNWKVAGIASKTDRDTASENSAYGNLEFYTKPSNASTSASLAMIIDESQNVGIGVAVPSDKLDILGADNGLTIRSITANRPKLTLINGSSTMLTLSANGTYGALGDGTDANRYMVFKNGDVGINTINPTEKLYVNGNAVVNGDLTKGSGVKYEPEYHGYVVTSDNNYKLLARISSGSGYSGACEFSLSGTTNSTVFQTVGVASANHSYDGSILTHVTSHYSGIKIKIVSNANNEFELYVAINTYQTYNVGVSYTIRKVNGNVTMAPPSASYNSAYLVHTAGNNTVTTSASMPTGSGPTAY